MGHVPWVVEKRRAYGVIVGNLSDRDHLEDQAYIQQENITMGGIGWINVALVKKDVGAVMNRVMKLKFRDVLEIC